MKDKHELKHLAEEHYFTGKPVSASDLARLKESKYASVVGDSLPKFKTLFESTPQPAPSRRKTRVSTPWINKGEMASLIDEVDDAFNLSVNNPDPAKFNKVDYQAIKDFIIKFVKRNVFDEGTRQEVESILTTSDTASEVIRKLYVYA